MDFRIITGYTKHPKIKKLKRRVGDLAVEYHLNLIDHVRTNKPDGVLSNMDHEDIADACNYPGNPDEIVTALIETRLVDKIEDGLYKIHDWEDHNPYSLGDEKRSNASRFSKLAQANKDAHRALSQIGNYVTKEEYNIVVGLKGDLLNEAITAINKERQRTHSERQRTASPISISTSISSTTSTSISNSDLGSPKANSENTNLDKTTVTDPKGNNGGKKVKPHKIINTECNLSKLEPEAITTNKELRLGWYEWLEFKKTEHRFTFKSSRSEQSQFNYLLTLSNSDEKVAIAIIKQSINNTWKGLFELKTGNKNGTIKQSAKGSKDTFSRFLERERIE